jgi:hypothetical protein
MVGMKCGRDHRGRKSADNEKYNPLQGTVGRCKLTRIESAWLQLYDVFPLSSFAFNFINFNLRPYSTGASATCCAYSNLKVRKGAQLDHLAWWGQCDSTPRPVD